MIFFNPRLIDLRSEQFVDIECRTTKRGMSKCGTTENMHLGLLYCIKSRQVFEYRFTWFLLSPKAILFYRPTKRRINSVAVV